MMLRTKKTSSYKLLIFSHHTEDEEIQTGDTAPVTREKNHTSKEVNVGFPPRTKQPGLPDAGTKYFALVNTRSDRTMMSVGSHYIRITQGYVSRQAQKINK